VFEHVRRLTGLRKKLAPLRRGAMIDLVANERVYAFARVLGNAAALVVFNMSTEKAAASIESAVLKLPGDVVLHDELGIAPDARARGGQVTVELPARSAAVYSIVQ